MHAHLDDRAQVRHIDMIKIVLKKIIIPGHQLAHVLPFRSFSFMAGDLLSETLAKLLVQGAHQASDAILTHGLILKLLAADRGDGAANSVTLQDPVEAFARIYAMMEGYLDELLRVLLFLEAIALERLGHRFRFAQHAVVHPGVQDIAL